MSDRTELARRYHETVRAILLEEWDPIGIAAFPEARDEYDGYVGEIVAMLIRQEPKQRLFEHLWRIETQHMGLCGSRATTAAVASRLCDVREAIENGESGGSGQQN